MCAHPLNVNFKLFVHPIPAYKQFEGNNALFIAESGVNI